MSEVVLTKTRCNTKKVKEFVSTEEVYNYIDNFYTLNKINPTLHECVGDVSKGYIDYEYYVDEKENLDVVRDVEIGNIRDCLNEFDYEYDIFDASGIDGKGREKVSFRVIFTDLVFSSGMDMRLFVEGLDLGDNVDYAVYKRSADKKQNLRMPYTKKEIEEDKRVLKLLDEEDEPIDWKDITPEMYSKWITQNVKGLPVWEKPEQSLSETIQPLNSKQIQKNSKIYNQHKSYFKFSYSLEELEELVKMLNYKNQKWSWEEWRNFCWCLRNIADAYQVDLRPLCHEISQEFDRYDEHNTNQMYDISTQRTGSKLGLGSLIFWVKKQNPSGFLDWSGLKKAKPMFWIVGAGCLDVDIANYFNDLYGEDFIYVDEQFYYCGKNGIWSIDYENQQIIKKFGQIYDKLSKECKNMLKEVIDLVGQTEGEDLHEQIKNLEKEVKEAMIENNANLSEIYKKNEKKKKELMAVIKEIEKQNQNRLKKFKIISKIKGGSVNRLKEIPNRKRYIEALKSVLFVKDNPFDKNPLLFAFSNGVYDLEKEEFRPIKKDDYVCLNTGYDFKELNDKDLIECIDIISKIMPVKEERDFLLKAMSSTLMGKTLENFIILTGNGRNGKDTLITSWLMSALSSNYYYEGNVCGITQKMKSDLNVSISNMRDKRCVVFNEPANNDQLEMSVIKKITGGNNIPCRGLYQKVSEIQLLATYFMLCNDKPRLSETGQAVASRLFVIPFRSMFRTEQEISKIPDDVPFVYPVQEKFKRNDFAVSMRLPLINILIKYFKIFKQEGYILTNAPQSIIELAEDYLNESDDFYSWFKEEFEPSEEKYDYLPVKMLFEIWKQSDEYENLSKRDRRACNRKWIVKSIKENNSLMPFYKDRFTPTINGKKLNIKNCLVGFKRRD